MKARFSTYISLATKLIPLFFSRGAVFIANILSAYYLSENDFYALSSAYVVSAMVATPLIAINNYIANFFNTLSFKLITCTLMWLGASGVALISLFSFDLDMLGCFFSLAFFAFVYISGVFNLRIISLDYSKVLNKVNFVGCFLFSFLVVYAVASKSEFYFYILYLIFPLLSVITFIYINNRTGKVPQSKTVSKNFKSSDLTFLVLTVFMGAPVHLAALNILQIAADKIEVVLLNIAFQWFILITLIPGMVSNVSVANLRDEYYVKVYKRSLLFLCVLTSVFILPLSYLSSMIYPRYSEQITPVIVVYVFCALLSVIYQAKINIFFANGIYKKAFIMSAFYAALYISGAFFLASSAFEMGLVMFVSYLVSLLTYRGLINNGNH
ncbi:hypothetical protein R7070_11045 [Vibrio sp. 1557]|uniref:hypothetical protein n=1 Tax=Vibrio sp. 1557 TaxID=3074561 RepID=UPI0029643085|nr:hypothetical protein [Vibrio sp. 1557]MDW2263291.1 hypothetical protein [Vibrio sp. 1557]